jgi:hypothetical protein
VFADAGHQSRKLARELMRNEITKRGQRAFKITGLTWIVERTFAWLGRNRRFSKDYEYRVQTSACRRPRLCSTLQQPVSCSIVWCRHELFKHSVPYRPTWHPGARHPCSA